MQTVREFSRCGPCIPLGVLVRETATRFIYRNRNGSTFWAGKRNGLVHVDPCPSCRDQAHIQ
jgi:hypothetical protein